MGTRRAPAPPTGAGTSGRRLWRSVVGDLELDPHEELILVQAVRCVDRLDEMAEALKGAPLTVVNAKGDEQPHPLLVESRQQSLLTLRCPSK